MASFAVIGEAGEPTDQEHVRVVGCYLPSDPAGANLVQNTPVTPTAQAVFGTGPFRTATFTAFADASASAGFEGMKVKYWLSKYYSEMPYGETYDQEELQQPDVNNSYVWTYSEQASSNHVYCSYLALRLDYITYDYQLFSDGALVESATEVNYSDSVVLPEPSEKSGYTFRGWKSALNEQLLSAGVAYDGGDLGLGQYHQDGTLAILNAVWVANTYSVTFVAMGGKVELDHKTTVFDAPYGELPTPVREGYEFAGWYTAASGGDLVTPTTVVKTSAAHVLYAHWTAISPKVHLVAMGGRVTPAEITVNFDSQYGRLPQPVRPGYTFLDWYDATPGGVAVHSNSVVSVYKDHVLYARWSANTNELFFTTEQGEVDPKSKPITYHYTYGALPEPTWTGHTFRGWYTNLASSVSKVETTDTVTIAGDHRLYALWSANRYLVSFDGNGAEVTPAQKEVTYGQTYGVLPTPADLPSLSFVGWFTDLTSGFRVDAATTVSATADHTLYAHWSAESLTVHFDAQGGSVTPNSRRQTYGEPYGMMPVAIRTGYDFLGWFTDVNTNGVEVTETNLVTSAVEHTLYAHWQPLKFKVSFDLNGGSASPTEITVVSGSTNAMEVTYGSPYGDLPRLEWNDLQVFQGWRTDNTGGTAVDATTVVAIPNDHVLYASWQTLDTPEYQIYAEIVPDTVASTNSVIKSAVVPTGSVTGQGKYRRGDMVMLQAVPALSSKFEHWTWSTADGIVTNAGATLVLTATESKIYQAHFALNEYRVNFHYRANESEWTSTNMLVQYGGKAVPPPTDKIKDLWTGHTFTGWGNNSYNYVTEDLDVYAVYDAGKCLVHFNPNLASNEVVSGRMSDQTLTYGKREQLAACNFKRSGYTFKHWLVNTNYVETTSTTNTVADCAVLEDQLWASEITLYADWEEVIEPITGVIKVDSNNGTGSNLYFTVTKGKEFKLYNPFTPQTDELFYGWGTNETYRGRTGVGWGTDVVTKGYWEDGFDASQLITQAGATNTVYALWKVNVSDISIALGCDKLRFEWVENTNFKTNVVMNGNGGYFESKLINTDWQIGPDSKEYSDLRALLGASTNCFYLNFEWMGSFENTELQVKIGDGNTARKELTKDEKGWKVDLSDVPYPMNPGDKKYLYIRHYCTASTPADDTSTISKLTWTTTSP